MRRERQLALPIEIDGGVHKENLAEVVRAGCDWIVTGSAVFHSPDPEGTVREMRKIADGATAVRVLKVLQKIGIIYGSETVFVNSWWQAR